MDALFGLADPMLLEDQLGWLIRGFPFWLQLLVILLISSRLLLKEYGAERLVWEERWWVQLASVFTIGMLAGTVLYTWFLLDQPKRLVEWLAVLPPWLSLFPSRVVGPMTAPGQVVIIGMTAYGLVLFAAKLLLAPCRDNPKKRWDYFRARRLLLPGLVGYAAAFAFPMGLYFADEHHDIRDMLGDVIMIQETANGRGRFVPYAEQTGPTGVASAPSMKMSDYRTTPTPILEHHAVATYLVLVNLAIIATLTLVYFPLRYLRPRWVIGGPVVLASHALLIANQAYGFAVFNLPYAFTIVGVVLLVLIVFNRPARWAFKYRFPGLEPYYADPFPLAEYADRTGRVTLLNDEAVLRNHLGILPIPKGSDKPKLVLVAVSGGGIRAAVWIPLVFEAMSELILKHIRLIAGASGGMVGAAAVVGCWKHLKSPPPKAATANNLGLVSGITAEQALLPVIQTMLVRDLFWNMLLPMRWFSSERSRELEYQWGLAAKDGVIGTGADNPFALTFDRLKVAEEKGALPSLIFAPVAIEDTRRVLISNLDLTPLTMPEGDEGTPIAVTALELFKMFPKARGELTLGTAARMNATFPIVSSNVSLPTTPPRRLIDAGISDNYGIETLTAWMFHHREVLQAETSGVAILEIRAFPLDEAGRQVNETLGGISAVLAGIAAAFTYPLLALLRGRGYVNYQRNSASISALSSVFNATEAGFFRTFPLELQTDASLNWYLSGVEKQAIAEQRPQAEKVLGRLHEWLKGADEVPAATPAAPESQAVTN